MSTFFYNDSELQMDSRLILCIEEHDSRINNDSLDTRLFIGWSNTDDDYFVRGKRQDIGSKEFVPYALRCESTNDLYDFIEFVVGCRRNVSIVLYNFNNTEGYTSEDLTYEFLESNIDRNYEMAAYDNVKLKRHQMTKYLRLLKNMYNWEYNCDGN